MLFLRTIGPVLLFFSVGCGGGVSNTPPDGGVSSSTAAGAGGAGAGGSGGSGTGGTGEPCTSGTTAFHMSAGNGDNAAWCVGLQCSLSWMTVSSMTGQDMPLSQPCVTNCADCTPIGCPALCIAPQQMQMDGESLTWDGTFWDESTCGARVSCRQKACAAPGRYTATMCAARRANDAGPFCMPTATPTCVDVPFDYPSAATVEGVLN